MWQALRSDLREFVSTVADDTSNVLTKIDATLDEQEGGDHDAEQDDSTELDDDETPLVPPSSSRLRTSDPSPNDRPSRNNVMIDADGNVAVVEADTFRNTGIISSPADEAARLIGHEETFLEPLIVENDDEFVELKEFLANFSIEDKTEEISRLLEENSDTLQVQFESLVPTQVKYEDFWQRYFFRCDVGRISRRWEEEQERSRQARVAAISGSFQSVRSLFGGALSAMSQTLEGGGHDKAVPASPFQSTPDHAPPGSSTYSGLNLFGAGGRPPFVMNTAVDESVDDDEEEEAEEELGWDDEEDDAGGEGDDEEELQVEEIEFNDDEKDQLQKQLAQAIDERDQLHETVELQRQKIAVLTSVGSTSEEIDKLKMELFEKDAELGALKASLDDTHDDDTTAAAKKDFAKAALQERELERLSNELTDKECELLDSKQKFRKLRSEMEDLDAQNLSQKAALEESQGLNAKLQARIAELEQALVVSMADQGALQSSLKANVGDGDATAAESQLAVAQQKAQSAQSLANELSASVQELTGKLAASEKRADDLEQKIQIGAATVATNDQEVASRQISQSASTTPISVESPAVFAPPVVHSSPVSSSSSEVKVVLPTTVPLPGLGAVKVGKDDEEEDWGDDWGDDDDN